MHWKKFILTKIVIVYVVILIHSLTYTQVNLHVQLEQNSYITSVGTYGARYNAKVYNYCALKQKTSMLVKIQFALECI